MAYELFRLRLLFIGATVRLMVSHWCEVSADGLNEITLTFHSCASIIS